MDNLHSPAYPQTHDTMQSSDDWQLNKGFTKLERASIMIAQGLVAKYNLKDPSDQDIIAALSVQLATTIIQHVNK
jgi:hypothetical protein